MRQPQILSTLKSYSWALFTKDMIAGLTVAMVALPLSIAIAIASGAEPAQGLVTAIVAGFFISLLGGSNFQIGGPTGAFIVVVFGVIADHGYDGLVMATFMAGIVLLVAGWLRMGRLIAYVPEPVINGFTIGIAIIIAASQLKDFFGLSLEKVPAEFIEKIEALWHARDSFNSAATLIALITFALIVGLGKFAPRSPRLIIAVALGSLAAIAISMPVDTIASRYGALPAYLPSPSMPHFTFDRFVELVPSAFVIAFLAGIESLLSAVVADRMTDHSHRPNAELLAQGAANVASAFFGGMPATGAIARTATNIRAGGKTPVAGLVHALAILVIMFFAAPIAGYLAMPALAALLVLVAWNMSEPHKWRSYMQEPKADIALLLVTLLLTVLVDLTVAIGVGVSIGLALRRYKQNNPPEDWSPREK